MGSPMGILMVLGDAYECETSMEQMILHMGHTLNNYRKLQPGAPDAPPRTATDSTRLDPKQISKLQHHHARSMFKEHLERVCENMERLWNI